MNYYSLNHQSPKVDFRTAVLEGQAPDGGLYFPEELAKWSKSFIENLHQLSATEIGYTIMKPYVGNSMDESKLLAVIESALAFEFPVKQIDDKIFGLELFHGPTLAFKDLGARFFSRCLSTFVENNNKQTIVLVATSGDTGSAVADAFFGMNGIKVVILYPKGKVSSVQELQLTCYGGNIISYAVEGDFDDCQRMVKQAFNDPDLYASVQLTSSNSINVARWLSQQIYYVIARAQWKDKSNPVVAVPSGNMGNICAGLMAWQSGLPIDSFLVACNANKMFVDYLVNGKLQAKETIPTLSNAMDVGNPSNAIRIIELFKRLNLAETSLLKGFSITDEETKENILDVYQQAGIILDPHSAVAYASMKKHLEKETHKKGLILSTAHPVKFPETIEELIQKKIPIPHQLQSVMAKKGTQNTIRADFAALKEKIFLLV